MIRFGFFYLEGEFTLYDLTVEADLQGELYVASLSANPNVCFRAERPEEAIHSLRNYLQQKRWFDAFHHSA